MNTLKQYPRALTVIALAAIAMVAMLAGGFIDAPTAAATVILADGGPVDLKTLEAAVKKAMDAMGENVKKLQDKIEDAREELRKEGALHGKTNEKLTELGEAGTKITGELKELRERQLEVEQKLSKGPGKQDVQRSIGQIYIESDQFKAAQKSRSPNVEPVTIAGGLHKTAIVNATGQNQPLVPAVRLPGVVTAPQRRLTIRDLFPQLVTDGNLIEFCLENVFTNNAGPQYDASSPTPYGESAFKNESGITFTLDSEAVQTYAHWIPASRQVLSDARMLQGYIEGRLMYGLKLTEEDGLLNGSGSAGQLNGVVTQQTAFTGGATNQTLLDTLLKAELQVTLSEYMPDAHVLHPNQWYSDIMLAKDTQNRYLFSDPHSAESPRVWGKPVVVTQSLTAGTFLTGAFAMSGEIYDREDAMIRISEHHENFFVKNMVAILCEERLALVIKRTAAIVGGNTSYAG